MLIEEVEPFVRIGAAIHLLHERSKRPIGDDWSEKPVLTFKELKARYHKGMNVGVRLGKWSKIGNHYLHVIDLDIRVPEEADEARDKLESLMEGVRIWHLPRVVSGSGGESRHIYFLTDRPYPSKKLAHSGKQIIDRKGTKHWSWEIELFGTGKQVAMPPSIHPDTGKPYLWEREFELEFIKPVPADLVDDLVFGGDEDDSVEGETEILNLSYAQAEAVLKDLPLDYWCEDREGWRNVGMALHHEFGGSKEAFDLWVAFSKQSRKFELDICRQQWRSFKANTNHPIRMASLIAAVREVQIMDAFDDLPEVEEDPEPERPLKKKSDPDLTILREARFDAPAFPTHIFGKFWGRIIETWAENGSAPVDFTGAGLLAVAGALVGNSTWVSPRQGWQEPPILWCQAVGLPSANKSPAFSPLIKILDELETRWVPLHMERHRRWQSEKKIADTKRKQWEAMMSKLVEEGKDPGEMPADCIAPPEPHKRRAYMTDTTIEALIRVLSGNERGFLNFRDEMTGWYANLARYSNGSDRPAWLEAYGGRPYVVDRVKDEGVPVRVSHFSVGILGGIQPDRLIDMLQSADDGLQARFIPFWPENAERPFSRGVSDQGEASGALAALSELSMKKDKDGNRAPHVMPFSEDALDYFQKWVDRHTYAEKYSHRRLKGAFGKANGHVARIALILELLWWSEFDDEDPPEEVSLKAVKAAVDFREEYIVPMQRRVQGHGLETTEARMAKAIAAWIVENRVETVNLSTMRREAGIEGLSGRTDMERFEEAVTYLINLRWLSEVDTERRGKGRPRKDYAVNPRIWKLLDRDSLI